MIMAKTSKTTAEVPLSHSVRLKPPPKARSLIESPTLQSESKRLIVRSLSMTEPNNSAKLEYQRQHRSYGENIDRIKRPDSPSVTLIKSHEFSLQLDEANSKRRRRKSRRHSTHRFYEPSCDRFPSGRITKSGFKSVQEMPFWRLDAAKFRRTVSAFETREMCNAKWRERTLIEMPFASQPYKKLVTLFGEANPDKLELKRVKHVKKILKIEAKKKRKMAARMKNKEIMKSRESRLIKSALKKIVYDQSKFEEAKKILTIKVREESVDYRLGGLELISLPPAKPMDNEQKQDALSKAETISKTDQPNIKTLKELIEDGDASKKKNNFVLVTQDRSSCADEKPPIAKAKNTKSQKKSNCKVVEAINTIEGQLRNVSACHSCERQAYTAESIEAKGQIFHNACFRCATCATLLTRGSWNHSNAKFYCNPCHRKLSLQTLRH